jgi:beta-N-acetylhexosaminidase
LSVLWTCGPAQVPMFTFYTSHITHYASRTTFYVLRFAPLWRCLVVLVVLASLLPASVAAQGDDPFVTQMLATMSVEEKVGQLFLVTFPGSDTAPDSDIATLINTYRIGGVVLSPKNGNFQNDDPAGLAPSGQSLTPTQVAQLTNSLQSLAFHAGQQPKGAQTFIPLFTAVEHEGDGYPHTAIRSGTSPVPSQMAIGASWPEGTADSLGQPGHAEKIGQIVGRELRAMGINLLLGPSLDVLNVPRPGLLGDLGTRAFGGDPYWVGKLGRAYIRGVHEGGQGRVATIAKHFPGNGGSDRSPDEEVATVDKSMQELRRIELVPFFAATQGNDPLETTDGLMSAHIRYRGFQGNIRQLTRPISLDAQGLNALMSLSELAPWRTRGLIVSDSLGVPAVRKYYDPQLTSFPFKRVAQEALLAGNDVLMVSQFGTTDDWESQLDNVKATIEFFREKYLTDSAFQARVDAAVRRILTLKRKLYPRFTLDEIWVDLARIPRMVGSDQGEVAQVARDAITLIYPGPEELADRLPSPPLSDEDILIFTDAREVSDCATLQAEPQGEACPAYPLIPPDAIEKLIVQLYSPIGQVDASRVHSLTFAQLKAFLQPTEGAELPKAEWDRIQKLLQDADWLIFAMLDLNTAEDPSSDAVKVFLKERSDSLRDKKIVALAYAAPYYLDSTEISKLTAYYGIYSRTPPFLEASVRALFREFPPQGASPVSIPGINYDLVSRLEPSPAQAIETRLLLPLRGNSVDVGTTLRVRTSPIIDRNGRLVPDGTPVTFRAFYPVDSVYLTQQDATTVNGVAEANILAERPGQLEISATSGQSAQSVPLVLTIIGDRSVTATPPPTITPTATPQPPPVTPAAPTDHDQPVRRGVDWGDLAVSILGVTLVGGAAHVVSREQGAALQVSVWLALISVAGGLGGYLLYGTGLLPAVGGLSPRWEVVLVSMACAMLAPLVARYVTRAT